MDESSVDISGPTTFVANTAQGNGGEDRSRLLREKARGKASKCSWRLKSLEFDFGKTANLVHADRLDGKGNYRWGAVTFSGDVFPTSRTGLEAHSLILELRYLFLLRGLIFARFPEGS